MWSIEQDFEIGRDWDKKFFQLRILCACRSEWGC